MSIFVRNYCNQYFNRFFIVIIIIMLNYYYVFGILIIDNSMVGIFQNINNLEYIQANIFSVRRQQLLYVCVFLLLQKLFYSSLNHIFLQSKIYFFKQRMYVVWWRSEN